MIDHSRRLACVNLKAKEVLGDVKKANQWLNTPMAELSGQLPISVINTSDGYWFIMHVLSTIENTPKT